MTDKEAIQMMERCASEIRSLRAEIARLAPKAEAYDNIQTILGLLPRAHHREGEDWAWRLDKRIEELKAAAKEENT